MEIVDESSHAGREKDVSKFAGTEQVCARLGWEYWLVGGRGPVLAAHLRSLAGFRHPPRGEAVIGERRRELFSASGCMLGGLGQMGDPIAVLPVLFHLRWCL